MEPDPQQKANQSDAQKRLLSVLPYLRHAVAEAEKEGKAKIGILAVHDDNSGRIICQFGSEIVRDLEILTGAPPQSEEDNLNAQALQFVDGYGLRERPDAQ